VDQKQLHPFRDQRCQIVDRIEFVGSATQVIRIKSVAQSRLSLRGHLRQTTWRPRGVVHYGIDTENPIYSGWMAKCPGAGNQATVALSYHSATVIKVERAREHLVELLKDLRTGRTAKGYADIYSGNT
jgi:hypothetical protein